MNLFGFNKKPKEDKFFITEPDRNWVEDNLKWLIKVYGYPQRQNEQIILSEHFFPKTFIAEIVEIENLIFDLSMLFALDSKKISFETQEDLRDTYGMPYQIEGKPFEAETEIGDNGYKIYIAKSLTKHPKRLIYNLIYEFIKIRLSESKLQFDTGNDTSLFIYIAGIYFGFGVILSQNLTDTGRVDDGFWETKWNYISEMPKEIMAFGLATYSKLIEKDNLGWKDELPKELRLQFTKAIDYLNEFPSDAFEKAELEALDLFNLADKEYHNQDYDSAISTLQKILFITNDELLKAEVYNNIGYYQIRKGDLEKSIQNFQKALDIEPNYGFANDNLGYALIQVGRLEEGRKYLEGALLTENNDNAYTYRNLALYHFKKGELEKAKEYFKLSFDSISVPVDLLEFHYAEFLFAQDKKEDGLKYLNIAIEKGEPEAIKRANEIKKN
jgi:tetratricopeptide (TPR) repeat protein